MTPDLTPAQRALLEKVPEEWANVPYVPIAPALDVIDLKLRGLIETRSAKTTGRAQWRRAPKKEGGDV